MGKEDDSDVGVEMGSGSGSSGAPVSWRLDKRFPVATVLIVAVLATADVAADLLQAYDILTKTASAARTSRTNYWSWDSSGIMGGQMDGLNKQQSMGSATCGSSTQYQWNGTLTAQVTTLTSDDPSTDPWALDSPTTYSESSTPFTIPGANPIACHTLTDGAAPNPGISVYNPGCATVNYTGALPQEAATLFVTATATASTAPELSYSCGDCDPLGLLSCKTRFGERLAISKIDQDVTYSYRRYCKTWTSCLEFDTDGNVLGSTCTDAPTPPAPPPGPVCTICLDTCQYAHDGMCDEPPLCQMGTDCSDCGAVGCNSTYVTPYVAPYVAPSGVKGPCLEYGCLPGSVAGPNASMITGSDDVHIGSDHRRRRTSLLIWDDKYQVTEGVTRRRIGSHVYAPHGCEGHTGINVMSEGAHLQRDSDFMGMGLPVEKIILVLLICLCVKESVKLLMILTLPFSGVIGEHPSRLKHCLSSPFIMPFICGEPIREMIKTIALEESSVWPILIDLVIEDAPQLFIPVYQLTYFDTGAIQLFSIITSCVMVLISVARVGWGCCTD